MATKKQTIPKILRKQVWFKYIGSLEGACYVCNRVINAFEFECGHIISEHAAGPLNADNLRPICSLCNKSMGTRNLHTFKAQYNLNPDTGGVADMDVDNYGYADAVTVVDIPAILDRLPKEICKLLIASSTTYTALGVADQPVLNYKFTVSSRDILNHLAVGKYSKRLFDILHREEIFSLLHDYDRTTTRKSKAGMLQYIHNLFKKN